MAECIDHAMIVEDVIGCHEIGNEGGVGSHARNQ
jgi:hypothetical protein